MLLEFRDIHAAYGDVPVLTAVNYAVAEGEIVALLGGNASGKSTTMKTIMGTIRPTRGHVLFDGEPIEHLPPAARVRRGIAPVLEARRLFPRMTVLENLQMGAYTRPHGGEVARDLQRVLSLFPDIGPRLSQLAGTLSGGEQQMVAIARALMSRPRLICMDEPSMGLSPLYVTRVFEILREINRAGATIFLVEQNAEVALSIADRAYVLQSGRVVLSGPAQSVRDNPLIRAAYFGEAPSVEDPHNSVNSGAPTAPTAPLVRLRKKRVQFPEIDG